MNLRENATVLQVYHSKSLHRFELVQRPEEYFKQLDWDDKLAVAVSHQLSFSPIHIGNDRFDPKKMIYCFDSENSIHEYAMKILMSKTFPFINELNRFILSASESGLITKWLMKYRSLTVKESSSEFAIFKAESLIVQVFISLGMLLFAFVVVILEGIVHEKARAENEIRFWYYLEIIIDPYRHFLLQDLSQ